MDSQNGRSPINHQDCFATVQSMRAALLPHLLERAAFDGWNRATLTGASADAGIDPNLLSAIFTGGAVEAIGWWYRNDDARLGAALADTDLAAMPIRQRVSTAVRARLDLIGPEHREAARRAHARLLLPDGIVMQTRIIWAMADTVWHVIGDQSTDGNFYSKRAVLIAVFASTLNAWLQADDPHDAWDVLDLRIANVMQFEKFKAHIKKRSSRLPDPLQLLTRLRYGRR
jgi:ubiquinone biosynthesis protein COQ9